MWQLYKYHSLAGRAIDNLKQRKLWASHPCAFNDPFEFRLQRRIDAIGIADLRQQNTQLADTPDDVLVQMATEAYQAEFNRWSVVCFTEVPDDILMWSHYANSHTGFCLGFRGDDDQNILDSGLHQVAYSEVYPPLDFSRIWHIEGLAKILLTKNIAWAYEKEWRIIFCHSARLVDYPGVLNKVIFGLRTAEEDQRLVRSILRSYGEVSYYHVVQDDTRYQSHVQPL